MHDITQNYKYLSVRPDLLEDPPDLGLETHVQHTVGLVQNHVGNPTIKINLNLGKGEDRL